MGPRMRLRRATSRPEPAARWTESLDLLELRSSSQPWELIKTPAWRCSYIYVCVYLFHLRRGNDENSRRDALVQDTEATCSHVLDPRTSAYRANIESDRVSGSLRELDLALGTTTLDDDDQTTVAAGLRKLIIAAQSNVSHAQMMLERVAVPGDKTSRAGFLRTLKERIGPPPEDRTWTDEWDARMHEWANIHRYTWSEGFTIAAFKTARKGEMAGRISQGWAKDDALVYSLHQGAADSMARALREGDSCYAASTYALCDAFFRGVQHQVNRRGTTGAMPPKVYAPLSGRSWGLITSDPGWHDIERPDQTGFCGLTSSAVTIVECNPRCFSPKGFSLCLMTYRGDFVYESADSDVVCFDSMPPDEHGMHEPLMGPEENNMHQNGQFPPNTLFRLKYVIEPGKWEAPGGSFPLRRLLVVGATYRAPRQEAGDDTHGKGKMCAPIISLQYGDRKSFIRGVDDIITRPTLTMEQEFTREFTWTDWKGVEYTLQQEWHYVNAAAVPAERTPGQRDANNAGMTPEDFMKKINDFISSRRERDREAGNKQLPEDYAFLTLAECLSVRLYSGPSFQPINGFLRQIGALSGRVRDIVAQHPEITFAATVGHLCRAIRKIAAVSTPEEACAPLFRGVKGELPRAFWVPDDQDIVAAVDMGFMSTSRNQSTPVHYMGGSKNVLWKLQSQTESDTGFHCGADLSILSQFASEDEVLFPPCTMLIVQPESRPVGGAMPTDVTEAGKSFVSINVIPLFQ